MENLATGISIRRCAPGDEAALALVGQATFLETFAGILGGKDITAHCENVHSKDVYKSWLLDSSYAVWLVESNSGGAPVGYMVVAPPQLPLPDTNFDLELKRIYLLSKLQSGGLGRQLFSAALAHSESAGARRLLLRVYARNSKAIGFYSRLGFQKLIDCKFNVGGNDYDDTVMGMNLNT